MVTEWQATTEIMPAAAGLQQTLLSEEAFQMWMNALQHIKNRRVEAGEAALRNARLIHSEPRRPGADLDPILADSLLCRLRT